MVIAFLAIIGLCLGSFVNALVWRIHEQTKQKKKGKKELSIVHGRSMCPQCKHELQSVDLIPVLSWLWLKGACRYCRKPISVQYPLVELATSALLVASYLVWPFDFDGLGQINFAVWVVILTGLVALTIYDIKWMLLPNRIVYPLIILAGIMAVVNIAFDWSWAAMIHLGLSVAIGGGIFYGLFMISDGKWIGGGDVKLGFLLGFLLADAYSAFLMLLGASLLGTILVLPGLLTKKISRTSKIPFGPLLIASAVLVYLLGEPLIEWYRDFLLLS